MLKRLMIGLALLCAATGPALAQDKATLDTRELLAASTQPDAAIATDYRSGAYDDQPTFVRVLKAYKRVTAPPIPVRKPVGMNLSGLSWYSSRQTFANLLQGGQWNIDWKVIPSDQLDALGYPKTWPATGEVKRLLGAPTGGWVRQTSVACTWAGSGGVNYSGGLNVVKGDHKIAFDMPSWNGAVKNTWFGIYGVNNADPFRDFECHDANPANATGNEFSKEIIASASKYPVLRFMDWSATNSSPAITEANRPNPRTLDNPGMALENQIRLATLANADSWINLSWKADASYIRWAAKQAHDTIAPGHKAYVELSNEVWNYQFWQAQDNLAEAVALNIDPSNKYYGAAKNYSRRAIEVFKVWEEVFADRPGDLVRVLGTQSANSEITRQEMNYPGIADHIDAIAGAPYFNHDYSVQWTPELLRAGIDKTVAQQKATCDIVRVKKPKALCYTYEAGQHELVTGAMTYDQLVSLQRSPLMGELYGEYLTKLAAVTDLTMLFNDVDPITKYGAWGHAEYGGQTDAPKQMAVDRYMAQ